MSCYVVSDKHISAILGGANRYRSEHMASHNFDPTTIGQMLLDANYRSVEARYPDHSVFAPAVADMPATSESYADETLKAIEGSVFELDQEAFDDPLPVIATVKLIDCLMYQSCECPDWEESEAKKWLTNLKLQIISNNPEWDDAAWSI